VNPSHGPVITLALLAALCGPSAGAQSLEEAVARALAHDPAIASARQGVQSAELEASAAFLETLPTLGVSASYQYTSATASLSIPALPQSIELVRQNVFDSSLSLRWAPFTGFAQQAQVETRRLQTRLARNSLEGARTTVALQTVSAYRQAQAARLAVESLSSAAERAQLQVDQAEAREKQGMAQRVDVLTLSIARLDYDHQLISARASLADALDRLASLAGRRIEVAEPPDELPRIELPLLQEEKLETIRALAIRRLLLESARRLAESKLYPSLSVSAALHYGIPGVNPIENAWMLYGTAGLSLSWSYDWGGRHRGVRAAQSTIAALDSDAISARQEVELEFGSMVRQWTAMQDELQVLGASLELARTRMGIVKAQYDQGMASSTDFNDANLGLTQAELQYRSQLVSLLLEATRIQAASGQPVDDWSLSP
jgi:outer membrane protein